MANFTIIGTIMKPKEDNWYNVKASANGMTHLLSFSVKSNANVLRMNLMGYLANNESNRVIYAYKKSKKGKDEKINFLYKDKEKYMPQLSEYSKMVFVNGDHREEYCHNADYIESLQSKIDNGYFDGLKVKIEGNIEYSRYTNKNGEEVQGKKYIPNRIYVLKNTDEEDIAEANIKMFIDEDSVIKGEDEGLMTLMGKIEQYDSKLKRKTLFEESVEFSLKNNKAIDVMVSRLNLENKEPGKFNQIGVKVNLIRGSETVELTEDMLSEEDKLNLELGLMTEEELKKEKGVGRGSFREMNVFKGLMKGYSTGATLTDISEESYKVEELDVNEVFADNTETVETIEVEEVGESDLPF